MITIDDERDGRNHPLGLRFDDAQPASARIKVIGIGGGGGNAVERMITAQVAGIDFLAANTDLQALRKNRAQVKLQLDRGGLTSLVKWKMNPVTKTPVWDAWITVTEVKTAEEKPG